MSAFIGHKSCHMWCLRVDGSRRRREVLGFGAVLLSSQRRRGGYRIAGVAVWELVVMTNAMLAMGVQQAWVMILQRMVVDRRQTHASLLSLHGGVEVVLDRIVGSTWKMLGHFSPLGTHLVIELQDAYVFFMSEGGFVNWRVTDTCELAMVSILR